MSTCSKRRLRLITALAATATLANGFACTPITCYGKGHGRSRTGSVATAKLDNELSFAPVICPAKSSRRPGRSWARGARARSRITSKMTMADLSDADEPPDTGFVKERAPSRNLGNLDARRDKSNLFFPARDADDEDSYRDYDDFLAASKVAPTVKDIVLGKVLFRQPLGTYLNIGFKGIGFLPADEERLIGVDPIHHILANERNVRETLPKFDGDLSLFGPESDPGDENDEETPKTLLESGKVLEDFLEYNQGASKCILKIGERVPVVIMPPGMKKRQEHVRVSVRRIEVLLAWKRLRVMYEQDSIFEGRIIDVNSGGAIVLMEGLRGFLPGSHLAGGHPTPDSIGTLVRLKFIEMICHENRIVVSNRRAILEEQMNTVSRGDVVQGIVVALKPYGAFVEIRGMSGLLHISQISFHRIDDVASVLHMGMDIKCMIIDYDKVVGRISLSTKTLEPDPGDMIDNPQKVFDMAEVTAVTYHERVGRERKAREDAAKSIVMGLGDGLESFDSDVLANIADGIETVLRSAGRSSREVQGSPDSSR